MSVFLGIVAAVVMAPAAAQRVESKSPDHVVESVMVKAQAAKQDFSTQVDFLTEQVAAKQIASRNLLQTQRYAYEAKLQDQADKERKIAEANNATLSAIRSQKHANSALRNEAIKVQKSNDIMRKALDTLLPKMQKAMQFMDTSLQVTDDAHAAELDVLEASEPEPSLKHFLDVARFEMPELTGDLGRADQARTMSLLSVSQRLEDPRLHAKDALDPDALARALEESLQEMVRSQEAGQMEMKAAFIAMYEEGEQRLKDLEEKRKELVETAAAEKKLHAELGAAVSHLRAMHRQLQARLEAVRTFGNKAGNDVMVALKEVEAKGGVSSPVVATQRRHQ